MSIGSIGLENLSDTVSNAFHGTTVEAARQIVSQDCGFTPTVSDQLFLGTGVYFYEGDERAARKFARSAHRKRRVAVLRAKIRWGRCLNLFVRAHRMALQQVEKRLRSAGVIDATMGQVINDLAQKFEIDTVKGVQVQEPNTSVPRFFAESEVGSFSKLMICVRNTSNILTCEIVMEDNNS